MDVLNVNYNQYEIHLNKQDAYNLIHEEIQSTYKETLNPYHLKRMYFEFDQKKRCGILPFFVLPSHGECSSRIGCRCER